MKKITFLLLLLIFSFQAIAQVLNQPASWPNTNWAVTGTFVSGAPFIANPTLSANFGYDDDEAGSGVNNDIAAESPVIDLTAAFNAGETWLFLSSTYVYNNIGADRLYLQYWNADSSTWVNWITPLAADTPGAPLDNFCAGTTAPFNSGELNIAGFTPTQLSGFKYRVYYDDGDVWAWGFCFNSPTLTSQTPPACPNPNGLSVSDLGGDNVTVAWNPLGSEDSWEYVIQDPGVGVPTSNGTTVTEATVNISGLDYSTAYEVYVRADCGDGTFSDWIGPLNFTTTIQLEVSVDCSVGPYTTNYCYGNDIDDDPSLETFVFTSSDGSPLRLTFNSGLIESCCDELVVIDTDGTQLFNATVPGGDLTGLEFQSSGDTISFYINSDLSVSCESGSFPNGINYTVACATCVNPVATYAVRGDCETAPQFFVDVDLTDLGSATSITLTDNQGSAPQTVSAVGLVTFGPYANTTDIQITIANDDDQNCIITSPTLTQEFCQDFIVDCTVGASTLNYCYENGGANNPVVFTFTSSDGTALNLTFNAGNVENGWDELVVIDTDGSFIVDPADLFYGNNGDLSGLTYQSTGDTISFYINSDGTGSCSSSGYTPIDVSVTCATCLNSAATYTVRGDCANGSQFLVDVDITNLGSATSITVTDNQGSAPQTVTATGVVTFGPYPNTTDVVMTVANDDDPNCTSVSPTLTQEFCQDFIVDCSVGPATLNYCYSDDGADDPVIFTFTSNDGTPLNLNFNSGEVENGWDELVVIDTDGSFIVDPADLFYGNGGDLSGLTYQSTGDTISFYINSDGVFSCETEGFIPIDVTVSCATCINPAATYAVIDDCANGQQFLIDVNVTSLGDATSLTVSDNQGSPDVQVTATGIVQFGPYPFATPIVITLSNDQDVNCVINSPVIQVAACPPANDNCAGAIIAAVNPGETCDAVTPGTLLEATPSGVPSGSCGGNPDDDVWFQFTALGTQQFIQLQNISGFSDLDHAVYSGSCGSLVELYCSDEDFSVTPSLVVGNTYYVRVFSAGSDNETTTFDLCIQTLGNPTYCSEALPICAGFTYPSITGDDVAPPYLDYDCLGSQPDPTWNTILFDEAGDYTFTLAQTGEDGIGNDIDFIVWGPFNNQGDGCFDLVTDNIVDCSFSATATETITINNVQPGDIYILLITNYSQEAGTYTFDVASGPVNGTNCEVVCGVDIVYDGSPVVEDPDNLGFGEPIELCGETSIDLMASSPYADTYEWYLDGLPIPDSNVDTITATQSGLYQVLASGDVCDGVAFSLQVQVTLGLQPVANPVMDLVTCDDTSGDGFEQFDLESQTPIVLGSQNASMFNVSYHLTQTDAITNTGALTSPYTNTSNPQTIWIRIEDANAPFCIATTSFNLVISGTTPTATSANMELCDDASGDGFEAFNLTSNDVNVLNGQSAANFTVTYYLTEADANSETGPLTSPYTNITNPQTIWARVDNNAAVDCYAVVSLDLIVNPNPTVNASADVPGCDADDNGVPEYDLTVNDDEITGGQTGLTVTYYTTMADAQAGTSAIGSPTSYETQLTTIYVRVEDNLTGCYSVTSFNLISGEVPMTVFTTDFDYEVCPDATVPIIITATPQNYTEADVSIVWYQDGGVINGQTGLSLPVLTAGTYTIEVTFNETGCFASVSQEVIELESCQIPQGISPDGDGLNESFDLSNFRVTRIEIFNRLGTLVYSKNNYTDEWHGQSNNGDELPVGTYFYTMTYEGGAKQISAWVYLNK
ncbi:MAG: gliding motility-associated C-terminal domain-containing protein [Gelidibacter sp.]